jgi:asparagine synthase (glutamine-hydrolysing)
MTEAIAHRGPDDSGEFVDVEARIALGHRRLAVIDPSPLGHQPMDYADGRYRTVFNGEIYNFRELREELERAGCRFTTHTDTEVVLAAYATWGATAIERLRGMFALAIWDRGHPGKGVPPSLFLARDRFGIKPLLFSYHQGVFSFASELKSLLASGLIPRTVDRQAVWDYLSLGSVPQPRTILAHVQTLPAGCSLRIQPGERPRVEQYWDIADRARAQRSGRAVPRSEAIREVRRLLDDAARAHMIADVPVGAFLSGGIDSTAVVGLMSQHSRTPIKTYSVGFESRYSRYSELAWARLVAERYGTDHSEVIVTEAMVGAQYDDLVGAIDQPSLDGTNTFFVSQAARTGVTVSLSGIGGDELFAGYPQFRRILRAARLAPRGLPVGASLGAARRLVPNRVVAALAFLQAPPLERHASVRRLMTEAEKWGSTAPSFREDFDPVPLDHLYRQRMRPDLDPVAQVSYDELTGYMLNTLLRDADAMSMAHSLEVRPVLLDAPLAEYVFSLPGDMKVAGNVGKKLFLDALGDLIPPEIATRRKMGFELPLAEWLGGTLAERAKNALQSPEARSLFSAEYLDAAGEVLREPRRGGMRLWSQVMLIEWMRLHRCTVEG